ncbi:MAG: c-type cytochrome [Akkermansiaceae bacterium]|nr:c-type cytochrome [Akkermansiaceae bacterium]
MQLCLRAVPGLMAASAGIAMAAEAPVVPDDISPRVEILQPGVKLTLLAEHPAVVTPTGIDVGDDGRIWVVASHTHFRPDGYDGPEHDEILVFASDGSGRRVFYNKTVATMDLELGDDGWVYLAERDRILRVRDTDGDGAGDEEEDLAVLETEADYPHNGLSGLAWHPDGDLVFALGENFWKEWTLTGTGGAAVRGTGEGGIFRCAPDGTGLRRIARGFWNPFGVCVRKDGVMFAAENDPGARPPCRILHIVEGGDYGYNRRYGNAPVHPFVAWNGELRGTLPMLHASGEAPCGILPLAGGLLAGSWTDNRVDFYPLKARGASFETERVTLVRGSDCFRPTCFARGPDGAIYFTDWVLTFYHLHQRGRVWKLEIDPGDADWLPPEVSAPPHPDHVLAGRLRAGAPDVPVPRLLDLAAGDDAFLASAALWELSRREGIAGGWEDFSDRDRVSVLLARRLAAPQSVKWARAALTDADEDVRFEALRWIADEDLPGFDGEIAALLKQPELPFRLFEACLAVSNTLAGKSHAGVTDDKMLLERLSDPDAPPAIRAHALRLLPPMHKKLPVQFLRGLLEVGDPDLTREVVRTLSSRMGMNDSLAVLREVAADESLPPATRADALVGLAHGPDAHADLLWTLAESKEKPVREEALRALRGATMTDDGRRKADRIAERYPESADLVAAVKDPAAVRPGLPAPGDTTTWKKRLDAVGGKPDREAGRRLFHHPIQGRCASCHRHSGRGVVFGPELTTVADRDDPQWLLESILEPNREVAPQYYPRSLKLADGSTFTGFLLRSGGRSGKAVYRDITGAERAIPKTAIVSHEELRTSLMPPGLLANLTPREIRDLLAFLTAP